MPISRSPKSTGAKLGLATAVAVGSLPLLGAQALGAPIISDTLDVTQFGSTQSQQLIEGSGVASVSVTLAVDHSAIPSTTKSIALTDPGTTTISDIVTFDLTFFAPEATNVNTLTVTLTSLDGPPSIASFDESIAETGGAQDLTAAFASLVNLPSECIPDFSACEFPTISVSSSEAPAVPEPTSLALLGAGLVGLAFARRRKV